MEINYRGFLISIQKINFNLYEVHLKHPNGKVETTQMNASNMRNIEDAFKMSIDDSLSTS